MGGTFRRSVPGELKPKGSIYSRGIEDLLWWKMFNWDIWKTMPGGSCGNKKGLGDTFKDCPGCRGRYKTKN